MSRKDEAWLKPGETATVTVDAYRGAGGFSPDVQGLVTNVPRFGWVKIVRVFDYHRAEIRKLTRWEALIARVLG